MAKRTGGEGWSLTSSDPAEKPRTPASKSNQRPAISLEKRKKGKIVTLVRNLALSEADLKDLSRTLKTACGTGGTVRDNQIELQGDCRDQVRAHLLQKGFNLK